MKKENLIRVVDHEKGRGRIKKSLYEIVPEKLDDEKWLAPQKKWANKKNEKNY